MRARWLVALALPMGVALAGKPPADANKPKWVEGGTPAQTLWLNLDKTTNTCSEFDYHPNGGMRIFGCHMASLLTWESLQDLAGVPVFVAGPHTAERLDLDNATSFGHYNPEFVVWAEQALIPGTHDSAFRSRTQPMYDAYVQPLARVHLLVWEKLQENEACMVKERDAYMAATEAGSDGYYERWFWFMNPAFCSHTGNESWYFDNGFDGGVSGNVVKTAVGFWLRRSVDETADEFAHALVALLQAYDAQWLREHKGQGE